MEETGRGAARGIDTVASEDDQVDWFFRFLFWNSLLFVLRIKAIRYFLDHPPRKFRFDAEGGEELELSSCRITGEGLVEGNGVAVS